MFDHSCRPHCSKSNTQLELGQRFWKCPCVFNHFRSCTSAIPMDWKPNRINNIRLERQKIGKGCVRKEPYTLCIFTLCSIVSVDWSSWHWNLNEIQTRHWHSRKACKMIKKNEGHSINVHSCLNVWRLKHGFITIPHGSYLSLWSIRIHVSRFHQCH